MQVNNVNNLQIIKYQQNFKENSANSSPYSSLPNYQPIRLDASKAYASPQITEGYKEIETFDIPYIGKGKLYELANGHKIILVPKASKTYISTTVGAGFSDEPADKKDIAHLTEHLLANYWHNTSPELGIKKTLDETGTHSNAATGNCSTDYYMSTNIQDNSDLENLIKIQLGTLTNSKFSEEEIQKEKNIIIEEAKENGYFIDEERSEYNQTIKNLFNLDNSNGAIAEMTLQKIEGIKKEDLEKFYNKFYRPDNMTTVIVGNVDNNSIKIISKYLNKMTNQKDKFERSNISNIKDAKYIQQLQRNDIESKDKSNRFRYFTELSFIGPKIDNPKDTENLIILNKVLENRLKKEKIEIDVGIPSISNAKNIPQIISIRENSFEENTENNIKTICLIIDDLVKNPISNEELDKAKEQLLEDLSGKLEDNKLLASFLNDMLLFEQKMDVKSWFSDLKNASATDIQSVAKKYLDLNKASLVVIHPNDETIKKNAEVTFKGIEELTDTNDIKEYNFPNNLHVIFDSRPGIVKAAVSCKFLFEDKLKYNNGIIDAMQSSLIRNKNNEFPAGNWIDKDGITIRKFGSSDNLQNIINDVKKDLISPEFNNHKLEESKKYKKEWAHIATRIYPRELLENSNSFQKRNGICPDWITPNDLKTYHDTILKNSQGTVIITIAKEKLEQVESEIIKSLSELPTIKVHDFSKILNQEEPNDLEKNSIFLNKNVTSNKVKIEKQFKIIDNGNLKDEAGIILLNKILSTKLGKSLREDLGLTYSANSNFEKHHLKYSILTVSTETAKMPLNDSAKTTMVEIDTIINNLINSKVDESILNSAKKQIKSNLLIPSETSIDRNMNLESLYETSYDVNHSKKLAEALDEITSDDLQKLAKKYLTKPYLLEISGNKKAIEDNKEYLSNLGENIF